MSEQAVENNDGNISLQGEGMYVFALLQAAYRLSMEINNGMQFRQSTLAACQRAGLTVKSTKKGALADMVEHIRLYMPEDWEPGTVIQRALNS